MKGEGASACEQTEISTMDRTHARVNSARGARHGRGARARGLSYPDICQFELKTVGSACITAKSAALTVESLPTFGYNLGINNLWAGAVEGAVLKVVPKVHAKFIGTGSYTGEPGHTRVSHSTDEIRNDGNGPTRDSDTVSVTARAREGPAATLLARLRRNSFNVHVTADTEATGKMNTKDHDRGAAPVTLTVLRKPKYLRLRCETATAAQHGCWKSSGRVRSGYN